MERRHFLVPMGSETAPATILALDINYIDWQEGKADVEITNVIEIAEPNTIPPTPLYRIVQMMTLNQ